MVSIKVGSTLSNIPPPDLVKRKFLNVYVIFISIFLLVIFGLPASHAATITSPSSLKFYAPLNISNSQSTAAPANFSQMINWNYTSYKGYINLTKGHFFQNVEFFNSTSGTVIDSWLESNTSTNAIFWIKLPKGIPVNTTLKDVAIGFASNTTNLFNTNTVGEAPTLSATYGEYDNGKNVFNYYFNGSSDSGWTTAGTAGLSTAAPSGSLFGTNALYADGTNGDYMYIPLSGFSSTGNYVIQYYVNVGVLGDFFFTADSTGAGTMTRLDGRGSGDYVGLAKTDSWTKWNAVKTSTTASENTWYLQSTVINDSGKQVGDYLASGTSTFNNLGSVVNAISTTYTDSGGTETFTEPGAYIGLIGDGGGGVSYWNGIVIRAYPPAGIMPSVTFGAVATVPTNIILYLNGVEDANVTITYGTQSNFTATINNGTDYVSVYANGTKVAGLSQSKATYFANLSLGLYKVIASTNVSGVANKTFYETIAKATNYLTLTASLANFTYNNTVEKFTGTVSNNVNNQVNASFYINTVKKGFTNTSISYSNASAGTYTAVFNFSGNSNYSADSITVSRTIAKATPTVSFTSSPDVNYTYNGTGIKWTASITSTIVNSQVSGTMYINNVAETSPYTSIGTAGTYIGWFNTTGNQNYTATETKIERIIRQATPILPISFPSGLKFYAPLNISNSQSTAAPANFSQMITWTYTSYKGYINLSGKHTFQNVEFFNTSSGTVIDSWLESNTSTNAIFWIKLPNGIPASTTLKDVAIGFASNTTNLFNNKTTGEAPQLSPTYAEYDDGANVFNVYQNFAGTICPSGWTCTSNATINNGLTLAGATVASTNKYSPQILDVYVLSSGSDVRGEGLVYNINGSNNAWNNNQPYWGHGNVGSTYKGTSSNNDAPPDYTGKYIQSLGWSGSTLYWWENYTNEYTEGTSLSISSLYNIQLDDYPAPYDVSMQWVRARAYPPSGVMPSVTFGAVTTMPITDHPGNFIYNGTKDNISELITTVNNQLTAKLYINGVDEGSTTTRLSYLNASAGTYAAVFNTSGNQNYTSASTKVESTISKATPTLSITDLPGNFTYNGTKDNSSAVITTINSQLSASLYINGRRSSSTTSRASYLNASAGTYSAVFNTSGNQNYTSSSVKTTSVIGKVVLSQTLKSFPSSLFTYNGTVPVIQDTLNSSIVAGNSLSFTLDNSSTQTSTKTSSSEPFNFTALARKYAAAGNYSYVSSSAGDNNYTVEASPSLSLMISKARPNASFFTSPDNFIYNGSDEEFVGSVSSVNNQLLSSLYINGNFEESGSNIFYTLSSAGLYDSVLLIPGNNNYTAEELLISIKISKAVPFLYINVPNNFTYDGKAAAAYYGISSVNNQLNATVTLNNSYLGNISKSGSITESNPGVYTINVSTKGNQNYSSLSLVRSFAIYKPKGQIFNSNVISFNNSVINVILNESIVSADSYIVTVNKYVPGTLVVILSKNMTHLTGLSSFNIVTNSSSINSNFTIKHLTNITTPANTITAFSILPSFNETKERTSAVYFFELNSSQLSDYSLSPQNISMYKYSKVTGWTMLPTYLTADRNGIFYYRAYSDSLSTYSIAEGVSYNAENASNFTDEFISETGLPNKYLWTVTYNGLNQTQRAGLSMVFSNPSGNYIAVFYTLSNVSVNSTFSCTSVYYPSNVKAGEQVLIPNGLSFTVSYANYTECEPVTVTHSFYLTDFDVMLLSTITAVIIFIAAFIWLLIFTRKQSE
ncbi:MAG: hypothetical protein M1284_02565 [Candidatus Parvarchaeota archaeon]|nr:hypothetical protein [Candidatus Parvarchaeota archaeon]